MLQPRIPLSSLSVRDAQLTSLANTLNTLSLCSKHLPRTLAQPSIHSQVRYASHAAQGRANGPKDSAGRRLGAKKTASEYVIPGNIIFKQRGTKWFPGENVGIGKDHTIYAKVAGYVRYYRNPAIHPKRRYIGVALEKDGQGSQLPTPPNAITRRRLGMQATPIKPVTASAAPIPVNDMVVTGIQPLDGENVFAAPISTAPMPATPHQRSDGLGMAGFEIGRAAERKGVKVREYDRKDRWLAWRLRAQKVQSKIAQRQSKGTKKTKGKKSNKKVKL